MKFIKTSLAISLFAYPTIAPTAAIPVSESTLFKRSGFTNSCEISNFNVPFLSVSCTRDNGDNGLTEFNLDTCFGNENGIITRKSANKNFSETCQNFETVGATFTADCQDETGGFLGNSVNLDDFLSNDNGNIKCDVG